MGKVWCGKRIKKGEMREFEYADDRKARERVFGCHSNVKKIWRTREHGAWGKVREVGPSRKVALRKCF
jgi:hypothetical protein